MCANICVEQNAMYFFEKLTNTDFLKNTPVVSISDLPTFVSNLLNQYQEKEKLTWHNQTILDDEIWIKIGGDHGGDSFKLVLEVANIENPNSKENTFLIRMVECKDSNENLRKILDPVKDQINALDAMTWNDKNLSVPFRGL